MAIVTQKANLDLTGVPEAMLWPLWNRAAEQSRPDKLLEDPLAAELVERINFDFRGTFGSPNIFYLIRARVGDDLIGDYVRACDGEPLVICLGDGIDTRAWRIADPEIRWINVDSAEAIAARDRLLPSHPRTRSIACSALDPTWLREVPRGAKPFISAAGLLVYLEATEVIRLLAMIADWLTDATIFFDTIPPYLSQKTMYGLKVTKRYTAPAMPWGIAAGDIACFLDAIPGIRSCHVWTYADRYPDRTRLYSWLCRFAPLSRFTPLRQLAGGLVLARTYRKTAVGYCG